MFVFSKYLFWPLVVGLRSAGATLGPSHLFVFLKTFDLKTVARMLCGATLDHLFQTSSHLSLTYCNNMHMLKNKQTFYYMLQPFGPPLLLQKVVEAVADPRSK